MEFVNAIRELKKAIDNLTKQLKEQSKQTTKQFVISSVIILVVGLFCGGSYVKFSEEKGKKEMAQVTIKAYKEEKQLERKHELLSKCSSIPSAIYQETWNYWSGVKNNEPLESRAGYREKIQSIFTEANLIGTKLALLFKNQEIAINWSKMMEVYQWAISPITRQGISEADLVKELEKADAYRVKVIEGIFAELEESDDAKIKIDEMEAASGSMATVATPPETEE